MKAYIVNFILLSQTFMVSLFPQSIAEKFDYGMKAYHLKIYAEANRIFQEIINDYGIDDELYASARYYSAESLLKLGKKEEAAAGFEFVSNNIIWCYFREESLFNLLW